MKLPVEIDGAICWQSGLVIDADGSPRAYAEPPLHGLDYLANAGTTGNWYGLVCNAHGTPVVQGPHDPAPGFYVSPTALGDRLRSVTDPRRYVDSEKVPYISVPPELRKRGVKLGDLCMVVRGQKVCGALVADVGPHNKYGEGSIALAAALGIPSSPKNGGVDSGVQYVVFIGSTKGWPIDADILAASSRARFDAWGGLGKLSTVNL